MLKIRLLDNATGNLFLPVNHGCESDIYACEYDNLIKIFKYYLSKEILYRKEHILIALSFSKIYEKYDIIPELYELIYTRNGTFSGYLMEGVLGKCLDKFCKTISIVDTLFLFKNLQSNIKIIHDNGFCLTDFNPKNILVSKNSAIKFVDIDSFCLIGDSVKNIFCNCKYICPYSKVINTHYNIYSFYCLFIDILFKVNRKYNTKKEILKKINEENLIPEYIKEKLVYFLNIRNNKGLLKLDYLF